MTQINRDLISIDDIISIDSEADIKHQEAVSDKKYDSSITTSKYDSEYSINTISLTPVSIPQTTIQYNYNPSYPSLNESFITLPHTYTITTILDQQSTTKDIETINLNDVHYTSLNSDNNYGIIINFLKYTSGMMYFVYKYVSTCFTNPILCNNIENENDSDLLPTTTVLSYLLTEQN